MKKIILGISFYFIAFSLFAQEKQATDNVSQTAMKHRVDQLTIPLVSNLNSCDEMYIQTTKKIETTDPCLFVSTEYILSQPLHQRTTLYDLYMRFIQTWMDKTPDFTFNLNNTILELCKGDNLSVFDVYLTCLARAALIEKKANTALAVQLFAAYLKKAENKVKQTSKVKKLIKDAEENKLERYL